MKQARGVLQLQAIMAEERREWGLVLAHIEAEDYPGFLHQYIEYLSHRNNVSPSRFALIKAFKGLAEHLDKLTRELCDYILPSDEELLKTCTGFPPEWLEDDTDEHLFEPPETD